ncbi:unnamed protein product [Gordionus sp. m RMFG-2023]|uniref:four and a half LIM domains protein 2-like n=1 Tax=Gordionus sp. m RMFG-2023 TaxID=3053472 RepID=UPI0030DE7BB4
MECQACNKDLMGKEYVEKKSKNYCLACFDDKFASKCVECENVISAGQKELVFGDEGHYHEKCFRCSKCKAFLDVNNYETSDKRPVCQKCYTVQLPGGGVCPSCNQSLKSGQPKLEYKGKQYHENCFICSYCKKSLGNERFYSKDDKNICVPCYQQNLAQQCAKCNKPITDVGVKSKGEIFHKECFICYGCGTELSGKSVAAKDNKPYCVECYGKMFANRCAGCREPITGAGGMQYITYQDRHWHSQCFICTACGKSLENSGFNLKGTDIVCPECFQKP